ncbi:hypothetical protein N9L68_00995 [bacterium]|nr:hypothetical protein [bacterium]
MILPNTFLTVDANRCYIYISETFSGITLSFRSQIPYGNYAGVDLASALQTALRQHTIISDGSYVVTFDVNTGLLKITNDGSGNWHIATRSQLLSAGSWGGVNFGQNPQDANDVIGYDSNATATALTLQLNNMVMLIPFQNVYLTSSSFGMMNQSQGTNGETNILRRIPIDQPWGNLIKSAMNITCDWVDVSGSQLDTLSFQLRDPYGRLCDMKGLHISFAICLINKDIV